MIEEISRLLAENFTHAIILPCGKTAKLTSSIMDISSLDIVLVTREEEGVGISAGLSLAGNRPFMFIQSSGLGNSINAICSLIYAHELPLLIIASFRGYYNELIEAQKQLGKRLPGLLEGMGVDFTIIDKFDEDEFSKIIKDVDSVRIILLSTRLFD
ncbi:MAG: thiamine pyrophosphate-binding protein [Candidatus Thorarchaeota archaeon]